MSKKELTIIQACPDDSVFFSQTLVQLANFREMGVSQYYRALIFIPSDRMHRGLNPQWKLIEEQFPEAKLYYYYDTENILATIGKIEYIPLLRPYVLEKHFRDHPELEQNAIFYVDSDIVFSKPPELEPYLHDDICYLSDTKSYLNSDYFDGQVNKVAPHKQNLFKTIDVLSRIAEVSGITREICEKNKNATGGAQYLLKNINADFWKKVYDRCIIIRSMLYYNLGGINFHFFDNENAGIQSWATDMIAVLHTLWSEGKETQTPEYFNFNWGTDLIEKWDTNFIYHDAGGHLGHKDRKEYPLFNKRDNQFIRRPEDNPITYFEADLSNISPHHCSKKYVEWIQFTKEKYIYK